MANEDYSLRYSGEEIDRLLGLAATAQQVILSLITFDEYNSIESKQLRYYYVAKNESEKADGKAWRIYLGEQLIGEFGADGSLTLPKFPMRFPFRLA